MSQVTKELSAVSTEKYIYKLKELLVNAGLKDTDVVSVYDKNTEACDALSRDIFVVQNSISMLSSVLAMQLAQSMSGLLNPKILDSTVELMELVDEHVLQACDLFDDMAKFVNTPIDLMPLATSNIISNADNLRVFTFKGSNKTVHGKRAVLAVELVHQDNVAEDKESTAAACIRALVTQTMYLQAQCISMIGRNYAEAQLEIKETEAKVDNSFNLSSYEAARTQEH